MSGNDHASQTRTVPGADRGNPGPSGPFVGSRSKKALWHRVHETLQDMARRCSTTAPSSFCSASTPQCTKPVALRRRCKSLGPVCRRLLQKAGGARVQSRALYETTGGGAGPVGAQQRPRRLSRRAGGGTRRGGADRDPDGHPKSRTNGGNGPKVDIPFPRRNTRLESRWGNLEAMRASRRAQRTRTCCRAPSSRSCGAQESPLHGVARRDMAIGRRRFWQNPPRHGNSLQKGLSPTLPIRAVPGAAKGIQQWARETCLGVARGPRARGGSREQCDHIGAYRRRNSQTMVGVGTRGTLCRGVSRGSVVLPPRRGSGGLAGFAPCCKGGQTVLPFLRCRPLRAQVAKQGARVPFAVPRYR